MRLFNRVLATVLSLFLMTAAVLGIVEIVFAAFHRDPLVVPYRHWYQQLLDLKWSSSSLQWTLILTLLVALVLLYFEVTRRRPSVLWTAVKPQSRVGLLRPDVERSISEQSERMDGIALARTRIKRRYIKVVAKAFSKDRSDLQQRLTNHVTEYVTNLRLATSPKIKVRVRKGEHE